MPLDTKLPLERLRFLLQDNRAHLVLCQREGHIRLDSLAKDSCPVGQILVLEELLEGLEEFDGSNPACDNSPDDLAYVMFTSGTTGQPKGVMVPHRGIDRLRNRPAAPQTGSPSGDVGSSRYPPVGTDKPGFAYSASFAQDPWALHVSSSPLWECSSRPEILVCPGSSPGLAEYAAEEPQKAIHNKTTRL